MFAYSNKVNIYVQIREMSSSANEYSSISDACVSKQCSFYFSRKYCSGFCHYFSPYFSINSLTYSALACWHIQCKLAFFSYSKGKQNISFMFGALAPPVDDGMYCTIFADILPIFCTYMTLQWPSTFVCRRTLAALAWNGTWGGPLCS